MLIRNRKINSNVLGRLQYETEHETISVKKSTKAWIFLRNTDFK